MKTIKFLLMGEAGVGKSTLLDVYLWRLHNGCVYHDHRIDKQHYPIDVLEILTFNELHNQHIYQNRQDFLINMLCFDVTDRRTLCSLRKEWIPELLALNRNMKIFIVGLQCDQREQFLTKLTQNCVSHADGMSVCLYYEHVHYLECSSLKLASVKEVFDQALEIFFYENLEKDIEEQILKLCAAMQITFEFYGKVKRLDDVQVVEEVEEKEKEKEKEKEEQGQEKYEEEDKFEEKNTEDKVTNEKNGMDEEKQRNDENHEHENANEDEIADKHGDKEEDGDMDKDSNMDMKDGENENHIDIYAVEDDHFL